MVNVMATFLALASASGPTPTPSVSPSTSTPGLSTTGTAPLTWDQVQGVLVVGVVLIIAIGMVVGLTRKFGGGPVERSTSLVRGWMALVLVSGLVLLCVLAFAIDDPTLRNTLIGGLIASVSAVTAFYFSSKNSDQARQDLLTATFGTETVPKVIGLTKDDAIQALGSTGFALIVDSAHPPQGDDPRIQDQNPKPGGKAMKGTEIVASFP